MKNDRLRMEVESSVLVPVAAQALDFIGPAQAGIDRLDIIDIEAVIADGP
ncbi:MAG: hypothetical protein AAF830_13945 [Pseudomonadota bacterium]